VRVVKIFKLIFVLIIIFIEYILSLKNLKKYFETPKVQQSSSSRLQNYISEFKDILSSNGHILFCKLYDIKIVSEKHFNVIQHLKTNKHNNTVKREES